MKRLALPALAVLALPLAAAAPAGAPRLAFPVACEPGRTCAIQHYVDRDPGPGTRDYRCGLQTYAGHTAVDIRLPDMAAQRRGVAVLAAAPGKVLYVRDGVRDRAPGETNIDPNDPQGCGNGLSIDHGGGWTTAYCHLARGSVTVKPGDPVQAGHVLGKIGVSGNSQFPHLHFDVRHARQVVDPFAPDMAAACGQQPMLWTAAAAAKAPYRAGAVLNAGFTDGPIDMAQVENGGLRAFGAGAPYLVFYARAIGLLPGDEVEMELKAPGGASLAKVRRPPLKAWRAQDFNYVGDKRPATGWAKGLYVGEYRVWRAGKVAISRRVEARL